MMEQLIFTDEAAIAGAPVPFLTINSVGTDDHALRHRRAEGVVPARRSRRASCTSPSATPSPAPAPTSRRCARTAVARRRRVRHQRPEDVDQPHPVRRLRLARVPHRSRRAEAQGHLDADRADRPPGFSYTPVHTMAGVDTSATYYEDVRVPADVAGRRGATAAGSSSPTSSTTSGSRSRRAGADPAGAAARRARVGAEHQAAPTAAGSSTRSGCRSTWPGCTPRSSSSSSSTGRSRRAPTSGSRPRPTRRPPRCSAPSSPPRPTGC